MRNGLEKRSFKRLECPIDVFVDVEPVEDATVTLPGLQMRSRNISQSGICLEAKLIEIEGVNMIAGPPEARENRLRMSIVLQKDEPPLKALGEVRWYDVNRDEPPTSYHLGVEFLEMEQQDKERLSHFIRACSPKGPGIIPRLMKYLKLK